MVLEDSETLPLLQQDTEPRSGRRATRRVVAAVATLVALALAYSSTVPRAARRGALLDESAPLGGTSGTYGWSCKDCSGGSAESLAWSCNCQDKSQVFRGTSTVLKWTCQKGTGTTEDGLPDPESTELTNIDGCLQCATYNDAWGDAKLVVGIDDVCIAASPGYIASLFKND